MAGRNIINSIAMQQKVPLPLHTLRGIILIDKILYKNA